MGTRASALCGLALAAGAAALACVVTVAVLLACWVVPFPAFGNSNVLRALTVVAQVVALLVVAAGVLLVRRGERPGGSALAVRAGKLTIPTGMALLVAGTLGIPLAATRLYLMGVSVDQEFRNQFLTRSATSLGLPDMAYADLPSYYPSGWFWLGGRVANVAGVEGWAAFKPWSVLSIAVAAALVTVLWTRLLRTDLAAGVSLVSVGTILAYGSPEPYGAIVALIAPPTLLLAWHAVHPSAPGRGRAAAVATALLLGGSACFYTLYTGLLAGSVVLMALVSIGWGWWTRRQARAAGDGTTAGRTGDESVGPLTPIVRLVAIGLGSIVVALIVWAPYLLRLLTDTPSSSGTATHYLPDDGTVLPLPMFSGGIMGWLCLLGLIWIVVRCPRSRRAQALGLGVLTVYAWCVASMAVTLVGSTLLGFRIEVVLIAELSVAGVFCVAELAELVVRAAGRSDGAERPAAEAASRRRRAGAALGVVALALSITFAQSIPGHLTPEIRRAYTDTDGTGDRADKYPPGPEAHYGEVDRVIREANPGREPQDIVVESTADAFFAFHPYLAYQAVTSHYANPLGHFAERNAVISSWEDATGPDDLYEKMTDTPWRAPNAIITRRAGSGYSLRLAEDVFPNDPNVRRFSATIPATALRGPHFTVREVGPFSVILVR